MWNIISGVFTVLCSTYNWKLCGLCIWFGSRTTVLCGVLNSVCWCCWCPFACNNLILHSYCFLMWQTRVPGFAEKGWRLCTCCPALCGPTPLMVRLWPETDETDVFVHLWNDTQWLQIGFPVLTVAGWMSLNAVLSNVWNEVYAFSWNQLFVFWRPKKKTFRTAVMVGNIHLKTDWMFSDQDTATMIASWVLLITRKETTCAWSCERRGPGARMLFCICKRNPRNTVSFVRENSEIAKTGPRCGGVECRLVSGKEILGAVLQMTAWEMH
jgi:hypothetical protein